MRRFTIDLAADLPREGAPAPFPGKWPTRIWWRIEAYGPHFERSYIGKPNRQALAQFALLAARIRHGVEHLECGEFDRHSVLYRSWPREIGAPWHSTHSRAWGAYHHWDIVQPALAHFARPVWLKRIDGFRCYSPQEVLKREYVLEYKMWLKSQKWPQDAPPKKNLDGLWQPAENWVGPPQAQPIQFWQQPARRRLIRNGDGDVLWWGDEAGPLPPNYAYVIENDEDGRQIRWFMGDLPQGWHFLYEEQP